MISNVSSSEQIMHVPFYNNASNSLLVIYLTFTCRAFEHIFEVIQTAEDMKYLVLASYLEIYNEEIRDLLGDDVKKKLELKEHPDKGVYVQSEQAIGNKRWQLASNIE